MDIDWVDFLKGMVKPLMATAVVLMAVVLSMVQKLGLATEMGYSIARAFIQLSVIGFVLQFIFNQKNGSWIIAAYLFMVSVAGYTAGHSLAVASYSDTGSSGEKCARNQNFWNKSITCDSFSSSHPNNRNILKEVGSGFEVEQNRNWVLPTNCSTFAEVFYTSPFGFGLLCLVLIHSFFFLYLFFFFSRNLVSMQRAAVAESRADVWIQFEEGELQQRPSSAETHATWQMMHLSCSPPTHLTYTITRSYTLFPCGDDAKRETKLSIQSMNRDFTPYQFFEFLPMKNRRRIT
ncbi:uncharacterized protein LOC122659596 [Telopea speciosissima]|uniref:uncharacterized protein LOC122659596 n=1 Tax=Telopea speciosissima TaxID=54955 RepID=UPI001CC60C1E|nr:uncharacterized protein LOC122659596 [Telopea speciosissima]